jgi:hypothetical protein
MAVCFAARAPNLRIVISKSCGGRRGRTMPGAAARLARTKSSPWRDDRMEEGLPGQTPEAARRRQGRSNRKPVQRPPRYRDDPHHLPDWTHGRAFLARRWRRAITPGLFPGLFTGLPGIFAYFGWFSFEALDLPNCKKLNEIKTINGRSERI